MSDEHAVLRGMLAVLGLDVAPAYSPDMQVFQLYVRGDGVPYWFVVRCSGLSCDSKRAGEQLYSVTVGTNNSITRPLRSKGAYPEEVVDAIINYLNGETR